MQVLGGAGYTRDHPVEQHYRDNRLNPIHEGTNGIQALDLTGRKMTMAGGRATGLFLREVSRSVEAGIDAGLPDDMTGRFRVGAAAVETLTMQLARLRTEAGADRALLHAPDAMEAVGALAFAWIWMLQAATAKRLLAEAGPETRDFHAGQIATARYVLDHVLPRAQAAAARIAAGVVADDIDDGELG